MRVFVALDISEEIRHRISRFMDGVREFAPDARWVRPESLHLTLKFIGEKPAEGVEQIKLALSAVKAASFDFSLRTCGFFPTAKAARVFWVGIESGPELVALASAVDEATASLGIPKEDRPYSPHLTLARGGSGAPAWRKGDRANRSFERLQEKLGAIAVPQFGTVAAREFFLYRSELLRDGSRYTKMANFQLV